MSLKRDGPSAKPRVPANALLAACLVSVSGVRTVAATTLNRGAIFEGKYRIERHLGDGGMGSVYEAIHLQLHVPVALKLVRKGIGEAVDVEERFLREARAAARVRNEHVAQVLDVGRAESGESFIVMEFLDGFDLSEVETGETLPADAAVHYAMQVCHGMQVAHDRGVIHRDLKPSNLFVTTDARGRPLIKVLDFGISKQVGVRAGVITNSGNLMGSPCYVAPEQARDPKSADERADVWSLGVILYELLSGQLPFDGEEVAQILSHVLVDEPPQLATLRSDLPEELCAVVMRCLNKDRELRPNCMRALAELLKPYEAVQAALPRRRPSSAGPQSGVVSLHSAVTAGGVALHGAVTAGGSSSAAVWRDFAPDSSGRALTPPSSRRAGSPPPKPRTVESPAVVSVSKPGSVTPPVASRAESGAIAFGLGLGGLGLLLLGAFWLPGRQTSHGTRPSVVAHVAALQPVNVSNEAVSEVTRVSPAAPPSSSMPALQSVTAVLSAIAPSSELGEITRTPLPLAVPLAVNSGAPATSASPAMAGVAWINPAVASPGNLPEAASEARSVAPKSGSGQTTSASAPSSTARPRNPLEIEFK